MTIYKTSIYILRYAFKSVRHEFKKKQNDITYCFTKIIEMYFVLYIFVMIWFVK